MLHENYTMERDWVADICHNGTYNGMSNAIFMRTSKRFNIKIKWINSNQTSGGARVSNLSPFFFLSYGSTLPFPFRSHSEAPLSAPLSPVSSVTHIKSFEYGHRVHGTSLPRIRKQNKNSSGLKKKTESLIDLTTFSAGWSPVLILIH